MWRSTALSEQGFEMIVPTTAPESDAAIWADFAPHRVRTTSAPTQRTYTIAPAPIYVEPITPQPIVVPSTDSQGEQAPAQPAEQD